MSSHAPRFSSAAQLIRALGALTICSERDGDTHVIALAGELDLVSAPEVERELRRVEAGDADTIIVDLSGLKFVDSTGIRLLIETEQRSRWDAGRLALRRPPDLVFRVFTIAGIDELLPFVD
jgi:anti-anti-sigma factor